MNTRRHLLPAAAFLALFLVEPAPASDDVPLRSWTPAPFPAAAHGRPSPLADIGNKALVFIPFSPCRAVDTRNAAGTYGGPIFGAGESRVYDLTTSACGGMSSVVAYSLNITVTGTGGNGFLAAYPHGTPPSPLVSTINYTGVGQTLANAAVVPTVANQIDVVAGVSGTHVIIDVNGYYTYYLNTGEQLYVNGYTSGDGAIYGENYATAASSAGVRGYARPSSAVGENFGVLGEVLGSAALNSAGVKGIGHFTSQYVNWGVIGETDGIQSPGNIGLFGTGGVLGRGDVLGLLAVGNYPAPATLGSRGAVGCVKNSGGTSLQVCGTAGYISSDGLTTYGLYSLGNTGATGTKSFVEPHPTEPGKVIRYVSLEGPEAGTYFRGRGRTVGGTAVVEVPESFRLVTDGEGLTVQITSRGAQPTATSVESADLDRIVVRTTRDVEFSYLVQGVRRSFKDFQVIVDGSEFRPDGPEATLPASLSEVQKQSLIRSGVYNPDGTVNMETAERAGWARQWREARRAR